MASHHLAQDSAVGDGFGREVVEILPRPRREVIVRSRHGQLGAAAQVDEGEVHRRAAVVA